MPAPTSASAVVNAFLDMQEQDPSLFPRIDPMKAQKLAFYAHAWWLALHNEPLFDEEVYAWPWGPVVPHIYGEFMQFGRNPIAGKRATEMVRAGEGRFDFRRRQPEPPNAEVMQFLRGLWESHKHLSGVQLSNATHAQGEPWTIVKDQYGNLDSKPVIPNDLIKTVFKSKIAQ